METRQCQLIGLFGAKASTKLLKRQNEHVICNWTTYVMRQHKIAQFHFKTTKHDYSTFFPKDKNFPFSIASNDVFLLQIILYFQPSL